VYRYTIGKRIDQVKELEVNINNLKDTMLNYTKLLINHKDNINILVESLSLKLENTIVETNKKFNETQNLYKAIHEREDTKRQQIAKFQANCEIFKGELNTNKTAIENIKEAKANKVDMKHIEALCDRNIISNSLKHSSLTKNIDTIKEIISRTEDKMRGELNVQVSNLQYEIKELNADNNLRRRVSDNIIKEIKSVQTKVNALNEEHNMSKQSILEVFTNEFKFLHYKIAELSATLSTTNKPIITQELKLPEILTKPAPIIIQSIPKKEVNQIDKNLTFNFPESISVFSR